MRYHETLENVENLYFGYCEGKCRRKVLFLGAFANLRNAILSFVMSVCVRPSIRLGQLCSTGRIFIKFDTECFSKNLSTKFKFH